MEMELKFKVIEESDHELFWNEALNQMQEELGEEEFSRWFKLVSYIKSEEQEIILGVPSTFYRDQVKSRYQTKMESALKLIAGKDIKIIFEIGQKKGSALPPNSPLDSEENSAHIPTDIPVNIPASIPAPTASVPLPLPATVSEPAPVARQTLKPVLMQSVLPSNSAPKKKGRHPLLREDYTFDRYVIGENNDFASNAAIAISRNPGTAYNPFLIYGGVGLGKTHLMQAIGNYVHQNSERKILYITAENFMNEFIQGTRENKMSAFRNKYRFVDVLLIDDINFLEKKIETQVELFHTFNALYDANKQIIFTCDRPVSELKEITERLRSRFERGLNVDMQPPNYETRIAILKSKVRDKNVRVSDDVLAFIAENISTNVRDLEAALTKLTAYSELLGKPVNMEIAQQKLKDSFTAPAKLSFSSSATSISTIDTILEVVANYFSISLSDLKSNKRTQKIVEARQITMYIARETTEFSTTEIGQQFGGRHYTTVMHACEKIEAQCHSDPSLARTIQTLVDMVKSAASHE